MNTVFVYMLNSGPHYESATTTRIFFDKEKAIKEGLAIQPIKGNWTPHTHIPDYWESEFEWMTVTEKVLE